jgi:glutamyl-Q tRNA(Asp) synthetase
MTVTTRFAPSPTGYLHVGHAFAAANAWRRARRSGGRFLLRLEDIDPSRCRPEYADAIQDDLHWLGLDWDGPVRVQSDHLADYQAVLDTLSARRLIYPCFCTRADIAASVTAAHGPVHGPDGSPIYPGTCRCLSADERSARIAAGDRFALRLDMAAAERDLGPQFAALTFEEEDEGETTCRPQAFGDIVLARKDAPASYHLCVTHDDWMQGVTLVTRGTDLKPATDVQRLIQVLMGWAAPAYAHHPLVLDAAGRRLAKRDRAVTLRSLRAGGVPAAEVLRRLDQSE